jgi:hypothetical protein
MDTLDAAGESRSNALAVELTRNGTCIQDYCSANTGISACPSSSRKENGGATGGGPAQTQSAVSRDLHPITSAAMTQDLTDAPAVSEPEHVPLRVSSAAKASDLDSPAASSVSMHPSTEPTSFNEAYMWIGVGAVGTIFGVALVVVFGLRKKQKPQQVHMVRRRPSLAV